MNHPLREERMSDAMLKLHADGKFVLHHFTDIDRGDPHDHPWHFKSIILYGGYTEEIYERTTGRTHTIHRRLFDRFNVSASRIHRIVELPAGECWTAIFPGDGVRIPGFWKWENGKAFHRKWNGDWFEMNPFGPEANYI